jgi:hypothetical protein
VLHRLFLGLIVVVLVVPGSVQGQVGSHANPYPKTVYGSYPIQVLLDHPAGTPVFVDLENGVVGPVSVRSFTYYDAHYAVCADTDPLLGSDVILPRLALDRNPDRGLGAACFPFQSTRGDDTGSNVTVALQENYAITPDHVPAPTVHDISTLPSPTDMVYVVCIDRTADGSCDPLVDSVILCHTGAGGAGALMLGSSTDPCRVFLDPASSHWLYVFLPAQVNVVGTAVSVQANVMSFAYLTGQSA